MINSDVIIVAAITLAIILISRGPIKDAFRSPIKTKYCQIDPITGEKECLDIYKEELQTPGGLKEMLKDYESLIKERFQYQTPNQTVEGLAFAEALDNVVERLGKHAHKDESIESLKAVTLNNGLFHVQNKFNSHQRAAQMLQEINKMNETLIRILRNKYPDHKATKLLDKRYHREKIYEGHPSLKVNSLTSYTTDKTMISYCLRNKENPNEFIRDMNLLIFVSIHELAHMASKTIGHNKEFRDNFLFLLQVSSEHGLYQPVNYRVRPRDYCGLIVNSNPLY